jgi:hypothetical protein
MVDQVGGHEAKPPLRTDDGGQLGPLRLEAFLAFDLLALGDLFEVGGDLRPLGVGQLELRQAAFVKTTPPPATRSLARRSARSAAWTGTWRQRASDKCQRRRRGHHAFAQNGVVLHHPGMY